MSTQRFPVRRSSRTIALLAAVALMAAVTPALATTSGGVSSSGGTGTSTGDGGSTSGACVSGRVGKIYHSRHTDRDGNRVRDKVGDQAAKPPCSAPAAIKAIYAAANKIRRKRYVWGGGHARWNDKGYDCSGSVSYVLHAAGWLGKPADSGRLARWGRAHRGHWLSVYANSGHVYAVIAGLRWDTSMNGGNGPGWSAQMRSHKGFHIRHHAGY